jgi:ferredoxin
VVYSRPGANDVQGRDYRHAGHVDIDLLRRTLPHGRHPFYVCGPAAMLQSLVPALADWGVPRQDIHFEAFGPASVRFEPAEAKEPVAHAAAEVEVRFHRSGRTLAWDGQDANLLDFAERHGVAVDAGCRSGSCGTCETRHPRPRQAVRAGSRPQHELRDLPQQRRLQPLHLLWLP